MLAARHDDDDGVYFCGFVFPLIWFINLSYIYPILSHEQVVTQGQFFLVEFEFRVFLILDIAQSAGAVEYTDCTSAEG